ncbi:MAG: arginase family protein [Bacteroidia bacterium]
MGLIKIYAFPCDWGAGAPGGAAGPLALYQVAFHQTHLPWLGADHYVLSPPEPLRPWYDPGDHVYARHIEYWLSYSEKISHFLQEWDPKVPTLFLTGDHSWVIALMKVLRHKEPYARIGLLWIDAHADFHTPWTTPSGNLHGMSLAALTGLNTLKINPLPEITHTLWQKVCPPQPVIEPTDLCLIGLRSYEPAEAQVLQEYNLKTFSAAQLHQEGVAPCVAFIEEQFEGYDYLYISLDVDVWDASFVKGTGTPAPEGPSLSAIRQILNALWKMPMPKIVEVTEINPLADQYNQTALYAYGSIRPFVEASSDAPIRQI